ncbi:ELWxxDGT repeat protein [Polaribacter uvawellassae]|uniref:ELWxxDGT repeat protein n=1 Tax=Polaribacter uvawellassae TaxID=3133495 RepID=UPI003219FA4B
MKKTTFLLLFLLTTINSFSQITLVKDIVTSDGDAWVNSFIEGNGFVLFAYQGVNGSQVWSTDGTSAGTINIGENIVDAFNLQQNSIIFNNELYFVVDNGSVGAEVFKTDGTLAGTKLLKDINPNFGSNPESFTIFGGELYFVADDGVNGSQLWKTNGTEAGTSVVSISAKFPRYLTVFNDALYFQAEDNVNGVELWKSDGTNVGTSILKDINASSGSFPNSFKEFNGLLYFIANNGDSGNELWKTDGTLAGTTMLKDIAAGVNSSSINNLTVNGNYFIFTANDGVNGNELWKTDGTLAGTSMLKDITPGANSTNFSGSLIFNATTTFIIAETTTSGREIWKTDGTTAGTVLLKDINPGVDSGITQFSNIKPLLHNGNVYFDANDGVNGNELWTTDGTTVGTKMVKNINTNNSVENGNGIFGGIYLVNNKVVFEAFDTSKNKELWVTDGTEAGTVILKDINPGKGWGASLGDAAAINNHLLFNGSNGNNGFELWTTDGTEMGTVMLKNLNDAPEGSNPQNLTVALNKLYIKADSTNFANSRLLTTDGTLAGTNWVVDNTKGTVNNPTAIVEFKDKVFLSSSDFSNDYGIFYTDSQNKKTFVKKINPTGYSGINQFYHFKATNELIFSADDGVNGKELWKTDGTEAGTVLVKDIIAGADGSNPYNFFEFNNEIYFTTVLTQGFVNRTYKSTLWKTDGTTAGTIKLKEFDFINYSFTPNFTEYKNKVFFTAYDMSLGAIYLWETDGTVAGTKATDISASSPRNLIVIGDNLFYAGTNFDEGQEMWKYDGTTASLFKSFVSGGNSGYYPYSNFTSLVKGNYYFLVSDNGVNALWKTNGTLAGTSKVIENFSYIKEFVAAGDILYFVMDDSENGIELWKSDGTQAGTSMVQDLYPGSDNFGNKYSSNPSELTIFGNDLYFAATSSVNGRELFKLNNAVLDVENHSLEAVNLKIDLYPNPATNNITVSLKNNVSIDRVILYNLLGKQVFQKNNNNTSLININISNISSGIYIVKVISGKNTFTNKLIIE